MRVKKCKERVFPNRCVMIGSGERRCERPWQKGFFLLGIWAPGVVCGDISKVGMIGFCFFHRLLGGTTGSSTLEEC